MTEKRGYQPGPEVTGGIEHRPQSRAEYWISQELSKEHQEHFLEQVEAIVRNPELYIDKGGAGTVYKFGEGLCMKILEPRETSPNAHLMDLGNTLAQEVELQRAAQKIKVEGVFSPVVYGYWKSEDPSVKSAILMEELDAINLQHILNKKQPLPETFEQDTFLDALSSYVDAMQKSGIVHQDLYARNVMVDRKTGMPRIIDFGRAAFVERIPVAQRREKAQKDWDLLSEIEEKVAALVG